MWLSNHWPRGPVQSGEIESLLASDLQVLQHLLASTLMLSNSSSTDFGLEDNTKVSNVILR